MASKGKGEQRQANRPGGRRSMQTDSPESGGGQLYKKKADHLVCFLFAIIAHIVKCRKTGQNEPRLATPHAEMSNAARDVCNRRTRRLKLSPAVFVESSRQNVCKNRRKVRVL